MLNLSFKCVVRDTDIKSSLSREPVAHVYNPNYSGGRDQEDCSGSQPRQIVLETLPGKNPSQKRAGGVAQGVDPELKPQYCKKGERERSSRPSMDKGFSEFHSSVKPKDQKIYEESF
jgi:hypothetical protein